jgi:hypothetical protein
LAAAGSHYEAKIAMTILKEKMRIIIITIILSVIYYLCADSTATKPITGTAQSMSKRRMMSRVNYRNRIMQKTQTNKQRL